MYTSFEVTETQPSSQKTRPKRAQVARACDWCRLARVKCDAFRPCRACRQAGRECSNAGFDEFRGVAAATREVQMLRTKIQQLEARLGTAPTHSDVKSARWTGVRLGEVQYGPSSLQYFIHRLETFTNLDLTFYPSLGPSARIQQGSPPNHLRRHQDYLLDLFWQGYHVVFPVIDEVAFRQYYEALWDDCTRKDSPLVDIILALCIQSYMSTDGSPCPTADTPADDYYERAHHILRQEDTPSLMAVQSYFLSIIYLLARGRTNSASVMVGTAVQVAAAIGLHDNNPQHARSTVWSCLAVVDTQLAMHLGRPAAMHTRPPYPESNAEEASRLGPSYADFPALHLNWLIFQKHHRQLTELVHTIQTEFYASCEEVFIEADSDFYNHSASREKCATILNQHMTKVKDWVEAVPAGLKTPRRNGTSFSTDRSPLDLQGDPLWLQRQRIILELEYHTHCMFLYRPFISFSPTPALGTLASDNNCIACINHAIAVTNILHQLLSETDVITGWYQLVSWQRSATFVAAGFACGFPVCPPTPSARKALEMSVAVFEMLGAPDMANVARLLGDKAGEIVATFRSGLGLTPSGSTFTPTTASELPDLSGSTPGADIWLGGDPSESQLWGDLIKDMDPGLLEWAR